jgi:hypothetical protein
MDLESLVEVGPDELRKLVEQLIGLVQRWFSEPRDGMTPMLLVLTRDGPNVGLNQMLVALAAPFNEDEEKAETLRHCGRRFCDDRKLPVAAALAGEAWESRQRERKKGEPRHDPEREEVIVVFGTTLSRKNRLFTRAAVTRDVEKTIALGDFSPPDDKGVTVALLDHFWDGFYEAAKEALGHDD